MSLTRRTLPADIIDSLDRTSLHIENLDVVGRERLLLVQQAVRRYLRGEKMATWLKAHGLQHVQVIRALERCLVIGDQGAPLGWPALMPGLRVKSYERRSEVTAREVNTRGGYAGALTKLLADFPGLKVSLDHYLLTRSFGDGLPESITKINVTHRLFIKLCEEAGVRGDRWPFCVENKGLDAIRKYVRTFEDKNYDQIVGVKYGERAEAKSHTGRGKFSHLKALQPYDIVELDEHRLHVIGSVGVDSPKGVRWVPARRLTIIALVDRCTQCVLGYSVICRREARSSDILKAVSNAIGFQNRHSFSLPELTCADGEGFPWSEIGELSSAGFCMLLIDNALVHLAQQVAGRISETTGCAINYGPVKRFARRPFIELLFNKLEKAGFHRIRSTTGSSATDPKRRNAEEAAVKHRITLTALLDLIELVFARYNAEIGDGNFGISALDQMSDVVTNEKLGFIPPAIPPLQHGEASLDVVIENGRIGGCRDKGERPHIYLDNVKYTNEALANRWDLIGSSVVKHIDEDNIVSFQAFTAGGKSIGRVQALGRWSRTPHSREARRQISALMRKGRLNVKWSEDPVVRWHEALSAQVAKKRATDKPSLSVEGSILAEEARTRNIRSHADGSYVKAVPPKPPPPACTSIHEEIWSDDVMNFTVN